MLGSVSFDAIRNSFLISITAHNEDPDAAALVANHYVKQFMEELFEEVGGKNEYAVSFLKDRAEELRKQSEASEARLEQYMQDNHVVSLDKDMNIVSDRLKAVDAALTADKLSLINLQDLAQQVEDYQRNHRDLLEISYIAQHGSVPRLRSQLSDLVQQQSSLSERYLERHPKMIAVADNIRSTQEQIAREIAQAVGDLKASLAEAARNVQALEADYAQNEKAELQLRALSVNYNTLANQESVAKNNYLQILDRLNQNTTSKNLEKIPLHPLDWATANYTPYAPSIPKIARTAASLGVLVFIGVAVGLSFVDDRIKSTWDVEAFLGVNLLGIVPDLANVNSDEKYTLLADSEHVTGGEAFLGIYSAVKIHSKLDFPKSILVTSTIPGEGKTLVSSNLAGCFARHGKNTLLIDCDLRRPMIHRHFKQQNKAGVIAWFESGGNLEGDLATNPNLGISQDQREPVGAHLRRPGQEPDPDPREPFVRPAAREAQEAVRPHRRRLPPHGRRHRRPPDRRAHRRSRVCVPLQPGLPEAHQALHSGPDERKERGARHRAQRPVAAEDRILLELPLLPKLQEVLQRPDLTGLHSAGFPAMVGGTVPLSAYLPRDFDPRLPVALVAGQGVYPEIAARSVRAAGVPLRLMAFEGETSPGLIAGFPERERRTVLVGQLGKMLRGLRDMEAGYVLMAGQITPRRLFKGLHPDLKAARILLSLKRRNAETIFGAIAAEIEALGITILDARAFLDDELAAPGRHDGPVLSDRRRTTWSTASTWRASAPGSTSARAASSGRERCWRWRPSRAPTRCSAGRARSRRTAPFS